MKIKYILLRLVRHFLPEGLTRFLLLRGWVIRPGLETSAPQEAVDRYEKVLNERGQSLSGRSVLVFGYGGRFAVGVELLRRGAAHVILADPYARPDERSNRALLDGYGRFLQEQDGRVAPRPEYITLVHTDIRAVASTLPKVDLVLSNSVYEHLDDVEGLTAALAGLTRSDGLHIHFIDLRDHYFRYPFEMLTFSAKVWRIWLNPTSNLNRFRVVDYRHVFETFFAESQLEVLERDLPAFEQARAGIRAEFLSGDPQVDSVTRILVVSKK